VSEIEGLPGELIDRLIELLNNDDLGTRTWYNVSWYVAFVLGGTSLRRAVPDTGEAPIPGSVGEMKQQQGEVVSRDDWFDLIQARLSDLVESGMYEAFLVRSVRDYVRRELEHLADIGTGDRNREETRERIERILADPAELAAFRARAVERDPSAANLSDEEITAPLRGVLDGSVFRPTSLEDAADRWAALATWDKQTNILLPDDIFTEWLHSSAARRPRN